MADEVVPVSEVDISNWQQVAIGGRADSIGDVEIMRPRVQMTRDEALVHAAWIIATVDADGTLGERFDAILSRVVVHADRERT